MAAPGLRGTLGRVRRIPNAEPMRCPVMWAVGPYRLGEARVIRDACPSCGAFGTASTDRVVRWHP